MFFTEECSKGKAEYVENLLSNQDPFECYRGFNVACGCGNLDVVKLFIDKGFANIGDGFREACENGQLHIINFLFDKGIDSYDLNLGLRDACYTNQLDAVKLLIDKGVTDFSGCLYSASYFNNLKMLRLLLESIIPTDSYYSTYLKAYIDNDIPTIVKVNMKLSSKELDPFIARRFMLYELSKMYPFEIARRMV